MSNGLRIGLDVAVAGTGLEEGAGGARIYAKGLISGLSQDPRVSEVMLYVPRWAAHTTKWIEDGSKTRVVWTRASVRRPLRVAYEQFGIPAHALRDRVDVLFAAGNFKPFTYRGCTVLTLHAIQEFVLPEHRTGGLRSAYVKLTVPRSVRTSDITITVTETLRQDTIEQFGVDPDRVVAVPMGPPPWVAELAARGEGEIEPYRLPDGSPYVMCISRLYLLKNHRRLLEAFAQLTRETDVPHKLVIVGGDADLTKQDLEQIAAELGIADRVVVLGRVPQSDVPGLYEGASAIAYVSLYETFGHPVLEAFSMNTPLLTSARGATAEVAGEGARLADPEDIDDIAAGLRDVLTDEDLRKRLVAAGDKRLADFSWERCIRETVDAFERALEFRRTRGRP